MWPPRWLIWFIWKYCWLEDWWFQHVQMNYIIPNGTCLFNCCCWILIDSIVQNPNEFIPKTKEGDSKLRKPHLLRWILARLSISEVLFRCMGLIVGWCFFLKPTLKKSHLERNDLFILKSTILPWFLFIFCCTLKFWPCKSHQSPNKTETAVVEVNMIGAFFCFVGFSRVDCPEIFWKN